jgi:general L-amino acid transport system substrate-binding protein
LGINSQNVGDLLRSKKPEIQQFLGQETNLGSDLGLKKDFTARIIKHVGNYG